jgi:hypothetical protein
MVALGQLLLPHVASKNRPAVLVHPIGEVLTGDAKAGALPALQFPFIDKTPFLHRRTSCLVHLYYFSKGVFRKRSLWGPRGWGSSTAWKPFLSGHQPRCSGTIHLNICGVKVV